MKTIIIVIILMLSQVALGQNSLISNLSDIDDPANVIVEKPLTVQQLADLYSNQSEELYAAELTIKKITKELELSETKLKNTEAKIAEMSSELTELSQKIETIMASTDALPVEQKEKVETQAMEAQTSIDKLKESATKPVEVKETNIPVLKILSPIDTSTDTKKLVGYGIASIGVALIAYFFFSYKKKP